LNKIHEITNNYCYPPLAGIQSHSGGSVDLACGAPTCITTICVILPVIVVYLSHAGSLNLIESLSVDVLKRVLEATAPVDKLSLAGTAIAESSDLNRTEGSENIKVQQNIQTHPFVKHNTGRGHKVDNYHRLGLNVQSNRVMSNYSINTPLLFNTTFDATNNSMILRNSTSLQRIYRHFHSVNVQKEECQDSKKVTRRNLETISYLIEVKRELALKLTPLILNAINKRTWPMDIPHLNRGIFAYVRLYSYITAVETSRKFIKSFETEEQIIQDIFPVLNAMQIDSTNIEKVNHIIRAYNYEPLDEKRAEPLVNREAVKVTDNWTDILALAGEEIDNIITKVWAIEQISQSQSKNTAGIDNRALRDIPTKESNKASALKSLETLTSKLKRDIAISKGKTDQAINRKGGIDKLTKREKYRNYLKSLEGKDFIRKSKALLKEINNNPVDYVNQLREAAIQHNLTLKFNLLNSLKTLRLKRFSPDDILRVYLNKDKGKLLTLNIPTLRDRCLQMLLQTIMEPYLEPLGDEISFGLRPGRTAHQAVSYLHSKLQYIKSSETPNMKSKRVLSGTTISSRIKTQGKSEEFKLPKFNYDVNSIQSPKIVTDYLVPSPQKYYSSLFLLDADIKGCFDNISHEWLIKNVPMPKGYEYLLPLILNANVVERSNSNESRDNKMNTAKTLKLHTIIKKDDNKAGLPHGGILSPILMNWTLDGLLQTIRRAAELTKSDHYSYYFDPDKLEYLLKQDLTKLHRGVIKKMATQATYRIKAQVDLVNTAWMVRYGDDFIVGIRSEQGLQNAKTEINKFLAARGLSLSEDKTKTIK